MLTKMADNSVTRLPSVFLKLSHDQLIRFVLKSGNEQWLSRKHVSFIVGGSIYKTLVGDKTNDVDIVTNNVKALGEKLLKTYQGAYHPHLTYSGVDHTSVVIKNTQLSLDLTDIQDMTDSINRSGLNMTNALVMCEGNNIKHVLEIPIIKYKLKWDTNDAEKEREWVLSKIREKKYCNTDGLRAKDKEYFRNHGWTQIDVCECKSHGMFT
jgi:hypothetical protein